MSTGVDVTELVPVQGALIAVAFRRSARARRISLRVDPARGVVITLPVRASRRAGLDLLHAHERWVSERLEALPAVLAFKPGALVPLSGAAHEIVAVPGGRGGAWIEPGRILVSGEPEFLPRRVADCLKRQARARLTALAARKAETLALRPRAVRIKDTRSRWGSCAPDGTLAFCWRLICAPDLVQDYVVAHEVAHLRHMNHGPLFWALTEQLTPHRQEATAWLTRHGASLLRIG
jgi:predicted metal-dependent hydrolase